MVEENFPVEALKDDHRVLVGPDDRLGSKSQVQTLIRLGYSGDISFEPFSQVILNLSEDELKRKLAASLEYLTS